MGLVSPLGALLQVIGARLNVSCKAKPGVAGVQESVNWVALFGVMLNEGAVWFRRVRSNTYAAPVSPAVLSLASPLTPVAALSSKSAPITTVLPDSVTEIPNRSKASVLGALR